MKNEIYCGIDSSLSFSLDVVEKLTVNIIELKDVINPTQFSILILNKKSILYIH